MRVDGRDITVSGSLLQPLTRRTNDIIRLALAAVVLVAVVTSSLITRPRWVALEKSISRDRRGPHPDAVRSGVPGLRHRDSGAAIRDPDRPDRCPASGSCSARTRRPRSWPFFRCRSAATASRRRGGTSTCPTNSPRCRPSSSTTRAGSRCLPRCSPCPVPGCPPAGGTGGGRCCWPSCPSTLSSAP